MAWDIEVSGVITMNGRKVMPEEAYRLHAREIHAAVPRPYKLGLQHLQNTIGNALPYLRRLRPLMVPKASVINLAQIDALPTLFAAFVHVAGARPGRLRAPTERRQLRSLAIGTRQFLRRSHDLGVQLGCMQHGLQLLEMGVSDVSLSGDLLRLVRVFRADLAASSSLVGISEEVLAGAEVLATKLMNTCGQATELAMLVEADQRVRRQSFGLLADAYHCACIGVSLVIPTLREAKSITPPLARIAVQRGSGRLARARAYSRSTLDAYVSAESAEQFATTGEK